LRIADMLDAAETAVRLAENLDQDTFFRDRVLVDAAQSGSAMGHGP
jgi:uncharacterized protein with HEPN domain